MPRLLAACALLLSITSAFVLNPSPLGTFRANGLLAARSAAAKQPLRAAGVRPTAAARCGVRMMADSKVVDAVRAEGSRGSVVIAGAGLAGLSAAKALVDRGYTPTVLESRNVLGGKIAAWKDEEGDWYETGLHVFFGAYPNILKLFEDLDIRDRLQWKQHSMIFAMPNEPGMFSRFDFVSWIPFPFGALIGILRNNDMINFVEKLQFGLALVPCILQGQAYVEKMDSLSISEWLKERGCPPAIEREIFIAMSKALAFVDPDKVSATVILTALNRFLQEGDGSKIAFLDGAPPERLCKPLVEYIEARGGKVVLNKPLEEIVLHHDGSVKGFAIRGVKDAGGLLQEREMVTADKYVSCMPVHIMQKLTPPAWKDGSHGASTKAYFNSFDALEGVPVINVHLWLDRKLEDLAGPEMNQLLFSRSKLLSVYADMSNTCREYQDADRSMLEVIFAPVAAKFGGASSGEFGEYEDWIGRSDEDIVTATLKELEECLPAHFGPSSPQPATVRKSKVVKTPLSVYWSRPGMQVHRPKQTSPVNNFFLGGDWTSQRYLASMEGAVLSGKMAAEAIQAADEGRAVEDQSAVNTVYKGDWPQIIRNKT